MDVVATVIIAADVIAVAVALSARREAAHADLLCDQVDLVIGRARVDLIRVNTH